MLFIYLFIFRRKTEQSSQISVCSLKFKFWPCMGHSFLFGDHKMVFFILRLIERKLSIQARLRGYLRQLLPVIYYQGKDSGGFVIKKLFEAGNILF